MKPVDKPPGRAGGNVRKVDYDHILAVVDEQPNQWFDITEDMGNTSGGSAATKFYSAVGRMLLPYEIAYRQGKVFLRRVEPHDDH